MENTMKKIWIGNDLAQIDIIIKNIARCLNVLSKQQATDIEQIDDQLGVGFVEDVLPLGFLVTFADLSPLAIGAGGLGKP